MSVPDRWDMQSLRAVLTARAAELYPILLGEPNRVLSSKREMRFGRKGSISVALAGPKAGEWFDHENQVGGHLLQLIERQRNGGFWAAVEFAIDLLGMDVMQRTGSLSRAAEHRRAAALDDGADTRRRQSIGLEIFETARDPGSTPHVKAYLANRKLELPEGTAGRVIRFHPSCPFRDQGRYPAMIALLRHIKTDEPRGIHRTALTDGGKKAAIPFPRLALGPKAGAAIKLSADEDVTNGLSIGEGIETTIAGMMLGFTPAWSVGDAGELGFFPVLSGIESLTIFVDNDINGAGQRRARQCSESWTEAGCEVFRVTPERPGADLNDVIRSRAAA